PGRGTGGSSTRRRSPTRSSCWPPRARAPRPAQLVVDGGGVKTVRRAHVRPDHRVKRPLRPSLGHTEERGGRTRSEDPLRLDHRGEAPLAPSPSTPENEQSNAVGMTAAQQANDGRRVAVTKRDITLALLFSFSGVLGEGKE